VSSDGDGDGGKKAKEIAQPYVTLFFGTKKHQLRKIPQQTLNIWSTGMIASTRIYK